MSDASWWSVITGTELEQGDLFFDVPTLRGLSSTDAPDVITASIARVDAIIVTQSCDLEHAKSSRVLLARVVSWADFVEAQLDGGNSAVESSAYIQNLIRGNIPPLTLLHKRLKQPVFPWSVANFRDLHVVERAQLDAQTAQAGSMTRLRLRSPYKEHFAQAFARYFMRVGLPLDATDFQDEGKRIAQDVAHS